MKAALLGTGFWAGSLAEAAPRSQVELACCWSRDPRRREAFAERWGLAAAPTLEAALDGVEAVVIASANHAHEEQAVAAAERGLHVFVEKPIAHTVEAGERIRLACARAGVTLLVGHELRRLGAARKARELVEAGTLGRVVLAEATYSLHGHVKEWMAGERGIPLVQLGVHHADTLAFLLGPVAASAGAWTDEAGVALLRFASGAVGSIASSYVSSNTYWLRLSGTDGVLEYRSDILVRPPMHRLDAATRLTLDGEPVPFEPADPVVEELDELARCARDGTEPETGAAEGLAALQVILDAIGG